MKFFSVATITTFISFSLLSAAPLSASTINDAGLIVIPGIPGVTRAYFPAGQYLLTPTTAYHNANLQSDPANNRGWTTGFCIPGEVCAGTGFYTSPSAAIANNNPRFFNPTRNGGYTLTLEDPFPQDNVGAIAVQVESTLPDDERFRRILNDALGGQCSTPGFTNIQRAECANARIVNQREQPGQSTDEVLRDTEYFLRNFIGGQKFREFALGERSLTLEELQFDILLQNPGATAGYNTVKAITDFLGLGEVNRANPNNPNSRPGGFDASVDGFLDGYNGISLEGAMQNRIREIRSSHDVLVPLEKPGGSGLQRDVFIDTATGSQTIGLDPIIGRTYEYSFLAGPGVNGFSILGDSLPFDLTLTISDLFGTSVNLGVGDNLFADDIFSIFGVDQLFDFSVTTKSLFDGEYLLGLNFFEDGTFILARNDITDGSHVDNPAPIPVPAALPLLLSGLFGLIVFRRQKVTC